MEIEAGAGLVILLLLLVLAIWPPKRWWLWRELTRPLRNQVRPNRRNPRASQRQRQPSD